MNYFVVNRKAVNLLRKKNKMAKWSVCCFPYVLFPFFFLGGWGGRGET